MPPPSVMIGSDEGLSFEVERRRVCGMGKRFSMAVRPF